MFREVKRVLKDDGTLWLNLGDSYTSTAQGTYNSVDEYVGNGTGKSRANYRPFTGCKPKDLIGIPWMVAFALRADGWYLRSEIIWAKPNPMPESVTDRPTKSHEQIFLLAKSPKYFYDTEAIKEPNADPGRTNYKPGKRAYAEGNTEQCNDDRTRRNDGFEAYANGKICNGRNKRSVWTVTTKPYREAHFATFPPDLIEPCILAGTSEKGECRNCGKAWKRDTKKENPPHDGETESDYPKGTTANRLAILRQAARERGEEYVNRTITLGWKPQCDCDFSVVPQIVLDPFSGSGTTGEVAILHNRDYIGIELNPDYIELTKKRLAKVQPILV